ncbi:inorganic phosphate transporter, partial [Staphylococcus pseudintermedius]|uniref:inorganic phosphate transporter n=1 Tax=Staphylococcus pseudintermedius TaxID=283734 RepID=UPI000E380349
FYGIPSSASHALIGAIAGTAIASAGSGEVLHYQGFTKIVLVLILSPVIAFVVGFVMYTLVKRVFRNAMLTRTHRNYRLFQLFTASLHSFSHGTNDAQQS